MPKGGAMNFVPVGSPRCIPTGSPANVPYQISIKFQQGTQQGIQQKTTNLNKKPTIPKKNKQQLILIMFTYYSLHYHELKNIQSHKILYSLK